jgi:hypothetical protein
MSKSLHLWGNNTDMIFKVRKQMFFVERHLLSKNLKYLLSVKKPKQFLEAEIIFCDGDFLNFQILI